MIEDKRLLPQVKDRLSFVYIEKARIEQNEFSISIKRANGEESEIPIANLAAIFLGVGVSITQQAVKNICEVGCIIIWTGQDTWRVYGVFENVTKTSKNILLQCRYHEDKNLRLQAIRTMYQIRYPDLHLKSASIEKMRGLEGQKVKELYEKLSEEYNVPWSGRNYHVDDFYSQDEINKALTFSNQILYGVIYSALHLLGFSPAIGMIHTGNMNSMVFDIADLYKEQTTIPSAFIACANNNIFERESVIKILKDQFVNINLMKRIPSDLEKIFSQNGMSLPAFDGALWSPIGFSDFGKNYS